MPKPFEEVEGRTGKAIDAGDRQNVAGGNAFEALLQLAPIDARAAGFLLEDLGAAIGRQLIVLGVERLPVSAYAGIAEAADCGVTFAPIFCTP